jgi:hypothetical protein
MASPVRLRRCSACSNTRAPDHSVKTAERPWTSQSKQAHRQINLESWRTSSSQTTWIRRNPDLARPFRRRLHDQASTHRENRRRCAERRNNGRGTR